MPIDVHPARQGRRPEQIIAEQKARAVRANAQKTVAATAVMPPTKTNSTAVAWTHGQPRKNMSMKLRRPQLSAGSSSSARKACLSPPTTAENARLKELALLQWTSTRVLRRHLRSMV